MGKIVRDPAEWARDWGWVSRRRAVNLAKKIDAVADAIDGSLDDEGAAVWVSELRQISKSIAPEEVPFRRNHQKVAAMREP